MRRSARLRAIRWQRCSHRKPRLLIRTSQKIWLVSEMRCRRQTEFGSPNQSLPGSTRSSAFTTEQEIGDSLSKLLRDVVHSIVLLTLEYNQRAVRQGAQQ